MSNTQSQQLMVEWHSINWRKLERRVYKLQKRIYRASQRGDVKALRRLQKTLMKSWSARALAVRRVTQDNTGKKTAGVDGIKSLSPAARLKLVNNLKLGSKVSPTRRVWIPKPGTEEKRPLGIPTMKDRALQALVKLALEPEWEARFEPNSYGFRPGRSCHDAIEAIFASINKKAKYVLDADIAKCFDRIDHEALLKKLNTFPTIRRQVRAWLKAGVMDEKQLFPTSEGTPQGGVISPLLANIALHGMEERIKQYAETLPTRSGWGKRDNRSSLNLIRYADDFVILHEDLTVVQRCKEIISEWLNGMGLELKPSKTRLAHTLIQCEQEKPVVYWSTRMGNNPEMPSRVSKLLKEQKGKCTHCGLFFRDNDVMEVDHRISKSKGGKDSYKNWDLLHRHCHDTKTALDGSLGKQSGCNSAKPKPTKRLERVEDKWVMRYA